MRESSRVFLATRFYPLANPRGKRSLRKYWLLNSGSSFSGPRLLIQGERVRGRVRGVFAYLPTCLLVRLFVHPIVDLFVHQHIYQLGYAYSTAYQTVYLFISLSCKVASWVSVSLSSWILKETDLSSHWLGFQ